MPVTDSYDSPVKSTTSRLLLSTTPQTTPPMAGLFGSASSTTSSANANPTQGDLSGDKAVNEPPSDSVSDIRFSPKSDHLAASSWDNKIRIYEIDGQGQSRAVTAFDHEAPALNTCWSGVCQDTSRGAPNTC